MVPTEQQSPASRLELVSIIIAVVATFAVVAYLSIYPPVEDLDPVAQAAAIQ